MSAPEATNERVQRIDCLHESEFSSDLVQVCDLAESAHSFCGPVSASRWPSCLVHHLPSHIFLLAHSIAIDITTAATIIPLTHPQWRKHPHHVIGAAHSHHNSITLARSEPTSKLISLVMFRVTPVPPQSLHRTQTAAIDTPRPRHPPLVAQIHSPKP